MKKVLFNFTRLSATKLLAKGRVVYSGMNGNAYFPDADPAMPAFLLQLNGLEVAMTNATAGGPQAKAIKNQLLKEVKDAMRKLAMYVNVTSNGNVVMLTSSGFTVAKDPAPVEVAIPVITAIFQGKNPGEMGVRIKSEGSKNFMYQWAADTGEGELVWEKLPSIKKNFLFKDLKQGVKYQFCVVAVSSDDQQVISASVAQYVLQRN